MISLFLTPEELIELTHRARWSAQVRVLRSMGIEHRTRADGSVVILRAHLEELMGVRQAKKKREREVELGPID